MSTNGGKIVEDNNALFLKEKSKNSLIPSKLFTEIKNKLLHNSSSSHTSTKKSAKNLKKKLSIRDNSISILSSSSISKSANKSIKYEQKPNSKHQVIRIKKVKMDPNRSKINSKTYTKRTSKEFLDLKNSIEKQLKNKLTINNNYASFMSKQNSKIPIKITQSKSNSSLNNRDMKCKNIKNSKLPKSLKTEKNALNSLGCSPVLTDSSSNISSFSTSSIEDKDFKTVKLNTKNLTHQSNKSNLIDLKFRTELEKLFSNSRNSFQNNQKFLKNELSKIPRLKPRNNISTSEPLKNKAKKNEKLRDFLSLMTSNLVKDHNDLLVDHKIETIIRRIGSSGDSYSSFDTELSSESELTDFSLNIFNLIKNESKNEASFDDENLSKILIKMLVKTCSIFDVATQKTDTKISYWRYANPVVSVLKNDNKNKISIKSIKIDSSSQTNDDFKIEDLNSTITLETETCCKTVIEANKVKSYNTETIDENGLAQSIVELVSESLNLSTLYDEFDSDVKEHIYENGNFDENSFFNLFELDQNTSHEYEELNTKMKDLDDTIGQKPVLYENLEYFLNEHENKLNKSASGDLNNSIEKSNIKNTSTNNSNENKSSFYSFTRRILMNQNLFKKKLKNQRTFKFGPFNSSSIKAQDETLRDAENISDIENESDIDQWVDLDLNENENKATNKSNKNNNNINNKNENRKEFLINNKRINEIENSIKINYNLDSRDKKKNQSNIFDSAAGNYLNFINLNSNDKNNNEEDNDDDDVQEDDNKNDNYNYELDKKQKQKQHQPFEIILKNKSFFSKKNKFPYLFDEQNDKIESNILNLNLNELQKQQIQQEANDDKDEEKTKLIDSSKIGGSILINSLANNQLNKNKIETIIEKDTENSFSINHKDKFDLENINNKKSNSNNTNTNTITNNNNNKNKNISNLNCDMMASSSLIHEYENNKNLNTFLKKYESTTKNFSSKIDNNLIQVNIEMETSENNFDNNAESSLLEVPQIRIRTQSVDSLEEQREEFTVECKHYINPQHNDQMDLDLDINVTQYETIEQIIENSDSENDNVPEIKIDFQYELLNEENQSMHSPLKKTYSNKQYDTNNSEIETNTISNYVVGDFKNSQKLNEETVVKQRAREILKFWKTEEEKHKTDYEQINGLRSSTSIQNNNSQTVTNNTTSSKNYSNEKQVSSSNLDSFSTNTVSVEKSVENKTDQQVPLKRVKDRISVFESKCQENKTITPVMNLLKIKKGSQSNYDRLNHQNKNISSNFSADIKSNSKINSFNSNPYSIQSRIESFEKNKIENNINTVDSVNKNQCTETDSQKLFSNKLKSNLNQSKSIDSGLNLKSVTTIDPVEIQVFVSNNDLDNTKNEFKASNVSLDKKKSISISLNSLNDEELNQFKKNSHENLLSKENVYLNNHITNQYESNLSIMTGDMDHKSSLHRSESKDDSDIEEIEIMIDLKKLNEKNVEQLETNFKSETIFDEKELESAKINEVLKNIVMHLIPTTRKAYVDDIVDGIKTLMSHENLAKVNSPIDLPKNVVRFIQKRYSNLLNESISSSNDLNQTDKLNLIEHAKNVCMEDFLKSETDNSSSRQDLLNLPVFETTELTVVKEIRKEIMSSSDTVSKRDSANSDENILKVDEETLYIVEKIRQVKNNTKLDQNDVLDNTTGSDNTVKSPSYVDKEIRKNFELKSKLDDDELTKSKGSNSKDFRRLIEDLKKSIAKFNLFYSELQSNGLINEINDYQLHYFNLDSLNSSQNAYKDQASILVILFDKNNEENLKYNLEQSYQKSIIETHLNIKKNLDITIMADINLFYIDDIESSLADSVNEYEHGMSYLNLVNNSKFYDFSLFKRMKNSSLNKLNDANTYFLPVGRYFVKIHYKHAIYTNDLELNKTINETRTEKESIVDLSLLPLAIRSQLIYESEYHLSKKKQIGLPTLNILAVDSFLLQMEINKKRDDLIRKIIIKDFNYSPKQAELFLSKKKSFNQLPNLHHFMNKLETDLDSYYICEKVMCLNDEKLTNEQTEDLVKLNKLDALASFKCVQKYQTEILKILKEPNGGQLDLNTGIKKFFLIDNGNHYKCEIPIEDLEENLYFNEKEDESNSSSNNESIKNMNNDNLGLIENIQKRQNYIFSKDLMNVFIPDSINSLYNNLSDYNEVNLTGSNKLKNKENESETESCSTTYETLPKWPINQDHLNKKFNSTLKEEVIIEEELEKFTYYDKNLNQTESANNKNGLSAKPNISVLYQNNNNNDNNKDVLKVRGKEKLKENCLKLDLNYANMSLVNTKEIRDKIISDQIYKMFATIRDHQSSSQKAKGEMNLKIRKKKSGSWGYSSNKRHVIAKVMELPYEEDLAQIGITDLKDLKKSTMNGDQNSMEKILIRIDDFLNKKVSQAIQRSYSHDYLNISAGPRCRIRYVKLPAQTIKTQTVSTYEFKDENKAKTEYRTAPYDLKYWNILKILEEEERQVENRDLNFIDDYFCKIDNSCKFDTKKNLAYQQQNSNEAQAERRNEKLSNDNDKIKIQQNILNTLKERKQNENSNFIKQPQSTYIIKEKMLNNLKNVPTQNLSKSLNKESPITQSSLHNVDNRSELMKKIDSELEKVDFKTASKYHVKNLSQPNLLSQNLNIAKPVNSQDYYLGQESVSYLDLYKNYSISNDIVYYDYSKNDIINMNPIQNTKNAEFDALKIKKDFENKNYQNQSLKNLNNCLYSIPISDAKYDKTTKNSINQKQFQNFSDEYVKSQQNLFKIIDFQDQLLNTNFDTFNYEQNIDLTKPISSTKAQSSNTKLMKSSPNLSVPTHSKIVNLQSLILPNQSTNSLESKRNI